MYFHLWWIDPSSCVINAYACICVGYIWIVLFLIKVFSLYGKSIPLISSIPDEHKAKVWFVIFSRIGLNSHCYVMKKPTSYKEK
jgi:hypothetical protein